MRATLTRLLLVILGLLSVNAQAAISLSSIAPPNEVTLCEVACKLLQQIQLMLRLDPSRTAFRLTCRAIYRR